ncbi:MAG: TonB-dependent receptor domain-containing protein [Pseudomonadales bacterium]
MLRQTTDGGTNRLTLEYSATSQLPGYTALKSSPAGLFGGNPHLGRERAKTVALKAERETASWYASATVFFRKDEDLVDWTYLSGAPFARQANAMDADVTGVEIEFARHWAQLELSGGYSYLHKDDDYGSAAVDASFYALNYAQQRLNLALRYQPVDWLDVRLDNEFRRQRSNALRSSDDDAYQAALALGWQTPVSRLRLNLIVDNLTNSNFQQFPGTPAPRRQVSLNAGYAW